MASMIKMMLRSQLSNVLWLTVLGFSLLLSTLCAQNATAKDLQPPRFAYGANAADWSLTQYRVDPASGQLRHNGNIATGVFPAALIVHPSGRFLFSAAMTDDAIHVYRVAPDTGHLSEITQSPVAGGRAPFSFSIHPNGRFVYVSARLGQISAFRFDAQSGVLTPVAGSPFAAQRRTRSVKVHPAGKFLYASNAYDNSITAYAIDQSSGALSPLPGSPYSTGEKGDLAPDLLHTVDAPKEAGGIPYTLEIHPSGKFLYVTNWMGASLSLFRIDLHSGALTPLKGNPMTTGNSPYAVTAHPSGRFVYVTSWDAEAIFGYAVDESSGQLKELPNSPFYTPALNPIDLTFNAAGSLAYVTHSGSNAVVLFAVDPASGDLVLQQEIRTRYEPFDLALLEGTAVAPYSRFAYVLDVQQAQLRVFKVDAEQGGLTLQTRVDTLGTPTALAVDPQGRFVYLASTGERAAEHADAKKPARGRLAIYRVAPKTGKLQLVREAYQLGLTPESLAMDVSGQFLYAIDSSVEGLLSFEVNPETGLLFKTPGATPHTGKGPSAIALDPAGRFSFVANAQDNSVSVFTHRRMGTAAKYPIELIKDSKVAVGDNPRALAVDPNGKYLLVANQGDNSLSLFKVHFHKGLLERVEGAPYPTGKTPNAVVVHPAGRWVFVLNRDSGDISRYRLDGLQGKLTALPKRVKAGPQPLSITLDAAGRFAYVRNANEKGLRKFVVDEKSGELTAAGRVAAGAVQGLVFDSLIR
jgi:6-phosphogluconolactonase